MAVVDSWSLFGGHLCYKRSNWDLKTVAVVDRWSLLTGGRCLEVVVVDRWSLAQV